MFRLVQRLSGEEWSAPHDFLEDAFGPLSDRLVADQVSSQLVNHPTQLLILPRIETRLLQRQFNNWLNLLNFHL